MTSRHSRVSASKATASKATHFQPHIQGLRAIAVILVVLYHFWPGRLGGGYIGVDIFFVISGFLITGQLARELDRTGTIKLPAFWGKRVRRLLPASITVLVFCTLATIFILPLSGLVDSLKEILASTFYFENWSLAAGSVDYLGAHSATMVQHYWSLSLEEQFYVVWPLLLLGATWVGVKLFTRCSTRIRTRPRHSSSPSPGCGSSELGHCWRSFPSGVRAAPGGRTSSVMAVSPSFS
jgi:peptidoglycan/LPS O-acetylase OafA/YrhL